MRAVVPSACVCELESANPDVWVYLAQISGGKSLFPHLQELHWAIREPSSTELLFIVSSSLRRLHVCHSLRSSDSREWKLSQSMLFRTIFNVAPHLTHLIISDTHDVLLSDCLSNLRTLHTLRVASLDQGALADLTVLRMLSFVESLEELSIGIGYRDRVDFCGFPALKKLNIAVESVSRSELVSHRVLDAFSSLHLCDLSFRHWNLSELINTDELSSVSTTIAQRFSSTTHLALTFSMSESVRDGASFETAFAPLFPLPLVSLSLLFFGVQNRGEAAFTDNFFAVLATSWPHLLELSIVTSQQTGDGLLPGITPQALLSLACGCPQLQTLRLPSMRGPRARDLDRYPVLQHPLWSLVVDSVAITNGPGLVASVGEDNCLEFALLLDKLFPNLKTTSLSKDWSTGGVLSGAWKRVLDGVRLCQLRRIHGI